MNFIIYHIASTADIANSKIIYELLWNCIPQISDQSEAQASKKVEDYLKAQTGSGTVIHEAPALKKP